MNKKEKFWDRTAQSYDIQVNEDDHTAIKTVENTKQYLNKSDVVLDYACATGKFTYEIADLVKEMHGIDISSEMIAIAKRNAVERNVENAHFAQTDIFDKRYKNESFDVILAFNILHLLEEPQLVVQRISELLKPGGMFISATACMGKGRSIFAIVLWPLSKIGIVPHINFFSPSEVEDLIVQGSFEIIETEELSSSPSNYFVVAKKM